jgi:hypothetical protein
MLAGCLEQLLVDLVELVATEVAHVLQERAVPIRLYFISYHTPYITHHIIPFHTTACAIS